MSFYEESSKRAEEYKSGGYTLLIVGGLGFLAVVLIALNIIPWANSGFSRYLTLGVMGTLFLIFIVTGVMSMQSYKRLVIKASEEDSLTERMNTWCQAHLTRSVIEADEEVGADTEASDEIESVVLAEDEEEVAETGEELLYFRRTEKMKELILKQFPDLDAAFLDSYVDDFYPTVFEAGERS